MYVIDNAGRLQKHDDEPEYGVVIVRPGRNIGWEAGLNVGTAMSDADYVIWMNDDVRPQTPDWHKLLVEPMEIDKRIGLVGPRVRGHANYQGRIPEDAELTTLVDVSPHQHTEGRMPHFRMSFFCVAVRRKVWHDVGPVDDRFSVPATGRRGGDDYDYCWRAHLKHWDMVMRTDVWVNHVDQGQTYRMLNATKDNTPLLKEKWKWV
jgi:GT2 family glycosyltransferase